jgi:hypothetical protein
MSVTAALVMRTAEAIVTIPPTSQPAGYLLCQPMTNQATAKGIEPRDVVACRHCRATAQLMVSMTSPKDGRTLRVFRCDCGKLTSTVNRTAK